MLFESQDGSLFMIFNPGKTDGSSRPKNMEWLLGILELEPSFSATGPLPVHYYDEIDHFEDIYPL